MSVRTALQALTCRTVTRSSRINPHTPLPRFASSSRPSAPPRSKLRRTSAIFTATAISGTAFAFWDDEYNDRTITRNLRTAYHGLMIALDYKMNFDPDSLESINALHERASGRLLEVCEKNRGLYTKLAQALATQGPFLPPAYAKLGKLLDDAEHFDYEIVQETILRELGKPIEELFVSFDPIPIAAASIAQVHRARIALPDGSEEEVAVKVQRPDIRRHAAWDLWAYRSLLRIYGYFFELPLDFAADYISDQLQRETEFDHEALNSEYIRSLILSSPDAIIRNTVYVPRIHPSLCTPRVLTMEYIHDASKLTRLDEIERKGLNVKAVGRSVVEVFASQIFDMGFVQADGHPSNVLIRKHPNGKKGQHQVVLIGNAFAFPPHYPTNPSILSILFLLTDHGLYIPLNDTFRRQYCELWFSIFTGDMPGINRIIRGWGIGQPELFASATLLKPFSGPSPPSSPSSSTDPDSPSEPDPKTMSKEELKKYMEDKQLEMARELKERVKTLLTDVELVPKELIFIGRAMRILQANNQAMGSPVNRLNIMAHHASSGMLRTPLPLPEGLRTSTPASLSSVSLPTSSLSSSPTPSTSAISAPPPTSTTIQSYLTFLRFRTALFTLDAAFYLTNFVFWFERTRRWAFSFVRTPTGDGENGRKRKAGFEDVLENQMREMAKNNMGMVFPDEAFDA